MSDPAAHGSEREGSTTRFVRAAVAGDESARVWIFHHFTPLLRRQAMHRIGRLADRISPDDIVADVWIWALARLHTIRPRDGRYTPVLLSYIGLRVRGAANDAIEAYLRVSKRETQLPEDSAVGLRGRGTGSSAVREAWTSAAAAEIRGRIDAALDELDPESREVFILRVVEGLSNQEISEETGEKPNTVAQRYKRAREKLVRLLPNSIIDEFADE